MIGVDHDHIADEIADANPRLGTLLKVAAVVVSRRQYGSDARQPRTARTMGLPHAYHNPGAIAASFTLVVLKPA